MPLYGTLQCRASIKTKVARVQIVHCSAKVHRQGDTARQAKKCKIFPWKCQIAPCNTWLNVDVILWRHPKSKSDMFSPFHIYIENVYAIVVNLFLKHKMVKQILSFVITWRKRIKDIMNILDLIKILTFHTIATCSICLYYTYAQSLKYSIFKHSNFYIVCFYFQHTKC